MAGGMGGGVDFGRSGIGIVSCAWLGSGWRVTAPLGAALGSIGAARRRPRCTSRSPQHLLSRLTPSWGITWQRIPYLGLPEKGVEDLLVSPVTSPEYKQMLSRLRQARLDAGLTQAQVAEKLGVRQTLVSKVELGERRIDPIELRRFAELYGRPLDWFLTAD